MAKYIGLYGCELRTNQATKFFYSLAFKPVLSYMYVLYATYCIDSNIYCLCEWCCLDCSISQVPCLFMLLLLFSLVLFCVDVTYLSIFTILIFYFAGVKYVGPNGKVNNMCKAYEAAKYDLIVISDSSILSKYLKAGWLYF